MPQRIQVSPMHFDARRHQQIRIHLNRTERESERQSKGAMESKADTVHMERYAKGLTFTQNQ